MAKVKKAPPPNPLVKALLEPAHLVIDAYHSPDFQAQLRAPEELRIELQSRWYSLQAVMRNFHGQVGEEHVIKEFSLMIAAAAKAALFYEHCQRKGEDLAPTTGK